MTYRLSAQAERDLLGIYRYGVETWGAAHAERYDAELHEAFEEIADYPAINRERLELNPPARVHHHGAHAILYIERPRYVLIARVLHGSQDWARHF